MIHLRNSGYQPHDASMLLSRVDGLTSDMNIIIRDARVSSKYLEFDMSLEKGHLDLLVKKLESIGKLEDARQITEEEMGKTDAMEKARYYFNNERFWECHEVLEGIWKKIYEGEKDLVQGIILVAAAFVHFQKNNNLVSLSIFNRAMQKLSGATGNYFDIDIDEIKKKVSQIITTKKIDTFSI